MYILLFLIKLKIFIFKIYKKLCFFVILIKIPKKVKLFIYFMKKKFQYIVIALIIIIIYELYLIFSFKYIDLEKDVVILKYQEEIEKNKIDIEKNKDYFAYINTNSYKDYIAKSSQNKKNSEEEVVFIISKEESDNYKEIDTKKQIIFQDEVKKETQWMTFFQKWIYYVFKINIRY